MGRCTPPRHETGVLMVVSVIFIRDAFFPGALRLSEPQQVPQHQPLNPEVMFSRTSVSQDELHALSHRDVNGGRLELIIRHVDVNGEDTGRVSLRYSHPHASCTGAGSQDQRDRHDANQETMPASNGPTHLLTSFENPDWRS